jgi:septum formation protein
MTLSTTFILASQSPRRRDLLDHLGVEFAVHVSPASEEIPPDAPPEDAVQEIARQKAHPVAHEFPTALTLAADTVVVHDGDLLTKPRDPDHARAMLRRLRGTTHAVTTGLALQHPDSGRRVTAAETTNVSFGSISDDEIATYVETGSPMDKAGGYGIQDPTAPLFIDGIHGDYYNVVGLPLRRLYLLLRNHFGDFLV